MVSVLSSSPVSGVSLVEAFISTLFIVSDFRCTVNGFMPVLMLSGLKLTSPSTVPNIRVPSVVISEDEKLNWLVDSPFSVVNFTVLLFLGVYRKSPRLVLIHILPFLSAMMLHTVQLGENILLLNDFIFPLPVSMYCSP